MDLQDLSGHVEDAMTEVLSRSSSSDSTEKGSEDDTEEPTVPSKVRFRDTLDMVVSPSKRLHTSPSESGGSPRKRFKQTLEKNARVPIPMKSFDELAPGSPLSDEKGTAQSPKGSSSSSSTSHGSSSSSNHEGEASAANDSFLSSSSTSMDHSRETSQADPDIKKKKQKKKLQPKKRTWTWECHCTFMKDSFGTILPKEANTKRNMRILNAIRNIHDPSFIQQALTQLDSEHTPKDFFFFSDDNIGNIFIFKV